MPIAADIELNREAMARPSVALRGLLALAAARALQRVPCRVRRAPTARFADVVEEAPAPEGAEEAPEVTVFAAPVLSSEEMAARDGAGPLREFDWDAHLDRLETDAQAERDAVAEAERSALAGGDEWAPGEGEVERLAAPRIVDDEPSFLKPRWDEVDPAEHGYRTMPPSRGASWSRIRIKSDWWQFEDGERLKKEEGFVRFDHKGFNVTNGLFEPTLAFDYGHLDLDVVSKIAPAIETLGSICQLLEAHDGVVRIKYTGLAKNRVGIEAYATGLVKELYPELETLTFDARHVSDYQDGSYDWN